VILTRKSLKTSLILFLVSQIFFLIYIQFPKGYDFDEFHYVPAAKKFLELEPNRNWEHPPLGKLIMATGIALGGDRPFGWRMMSTLFGSITLVGMYFLALVLFRKPKTALWVALITLANQLLYVQARIGMLDTFMFAFLIWALVAFSATWDPQLGLHQQRRLFLGMGILLGLSTACKWFALIPWLACLFLIGMVRVLQHWKTSFARPLATDWYRPQLWAGLTGLDWFVCLGFIPIWIYYLTFIPYLVLKGVPTSFYDFFIGMQIRMWDDQLRVVHSHPYMSRWIDWPLISRPIWYAFDREFGNSAIVRGVLLIGNPLLMWSGLLAIIYCLWEWIQFRKREAFFIFYFYCVFFFSWSFIPRKIAFYYYYYPAGMMLSFALAYVFDHQKCSILLQESWARWIFLGAATCIFIYFFPILSGVKIPSNSFQHWMWFRSWI